MEALASEAPHSTKLLIFSFLKDEKNSEFNFEVVSYEINFCVVLGKK
jgi:hypothetical protein